VVGKATEEEEEKSQGWAGDSQGGGVGVIATWGRGDALALVKLSNYMVFSGSR
jgi:hypothetical protein